MPRSGSQIARQRLDRHRADLLGANDMHLGENFSRKFAGPEQVISSSAIPNQRFDCFSSGELHHVDPFGAKESQCPWHSQPGNI